MLTLCPLALIFITLQVNYFHLHLTDKNTEIQTCQVTPMATVLSVGDVSQSSCQFCSTAQKFFFSLNAV